MLRLFSFDDASLREVASHGRGPREYLSAGGLYRQRNGEVWLLDALQRRYLVLSSRGDARRTLPFAAPPTLGVSMRAGGIRTAWTVGARSTSARVPAPVGPRRTPRCCSGDAVRARTPWRGYGIPR